MPTTKLMELFTPYFADLPDPRIDRSKEHDLLDILVLALCATLGGANGWADTERFGKAKLDFFRQFLALPNGIPSHDTFGRVFARLDPTALSAAAACGLAPRECCSGRSVKRRTRLSKAGNARLRKALYLPALTAVRCNPLLKRFFERLVAAGKPRM